MNFLRRIHLRFDRTNNLWLLLLDLKILVQAGRVSVESFILFDHPRLFLIKIDRINKIRLRDIKLLDAYNVIENNWLPVPETFLRVLSQTSIGGRPERFLRLIKPLMSR